MTINQLPELTSHDGNVVVPASYNGADYKLPLGNMILKKSISVTTGADGLAGGVLVDHADYIVLAMVRTDATSICIPIPNADTGKWIVRVLNTSLNAVANTSVNIDVYYVPHS